MSERKCRVGMRLMSRVCVKRLRSVSGFGNAASTIGAVPASVALGVVDKEAGLRVMMRGASASSSQPCSSIKACTSEGEFLG